MGILDMFGNLSPEQTQGLLAAAAQMAQASGPSRTPNNMAAGLANSGLAYTQSIEAQRRKKMEEEAQQQALRMNDFKIQDAESDLKNQQIARADAERLSQFYRSNGAATASTGLPTAPGSPEVPQAPGAPSGGQNQGIYAQRLAMAERLRAQGFHKQADEQEAAALKFQPKVSRWEKVIEGGKVLYAPFFEDGSSGNPVPREVAEKLEKADLGGKTAMLNPYTGAQVASYNNTASPDAQLSASTQIRGQNMTDARARQTLEAGGKPQFSAELGGFISRPTAAAPNGTFTPLAGHTKGPKMTEDQAKATGWLVQAENGWANMKKVAYDEQGKVTKAAKPGGMESFANALPFGMGASSANMARSPDRQKFVQAASSLSESLLRASTGAGVTKEEAEQKIREVTPVWGDSEEVIKQKMEAVPLYIDSLKARAGNGAALAANVLSKNSADAPAPKQTFDMPPDAKKYDGKRIKADNGTIYVSRGGKWVKE